MSTTPPKKKSQGRHRWTLDAVALLKPFVANEQHISRRVAIKLVSPETEWERRELEKLRSRANKVIRGENIDILHYTVFDATLNHPSMREHTATFMRELATLEATPAPYSARMCGVCFTEQQLPDDAVPGDLYYITLDKGGDSYQMIRTSHDTWERVLLNIRELDGSTARGYTPYNRFAALNVIYHGDIRVKGMLVTPAYLPEACNVQGDVYFFREPAQVKGVCWIDGAFIDIDPPHAVIPTEVYRAREVLPTVTLAERHLSSISVSVKQPRRSWWRRVKQAVGFK